VNYFKLIRCESTQFYLKKSEKKFYFLFLKESWKMNHGLQKYLKQHNYF